MSSSLVKRVPSGTSAGMVSLTLSRLARVLDLERFIKTLRAIDELLTPAV